jgi:hypothetical protein
MTRVLALITMGAIAALVTAALLSLNPSNPHAKKLAAARIEKVSAEIEAAVDRAEQLPVTGSAAKEGSALALVALGWHESHFRSDVADCSACDGRTRLCDHGTSVSAYQMKKGAWGGHTREDVCADPTLAASLALKLLSSHRSTMPAAFRAYARGDSRVKSKPSREIIELHARLLSRFRFRVLHLDRTQINLRPTP